MLVGCVSNKNDSKYWEVTPGSMQNPPVFSSPGNEKTVVSEKKTFWERIFGKKKKSDPSKSPRTNPELISPAYRLRPGDTIIIFLQGIPNAGQNEDIIDETGYINLALIGQVKAAGKTSSELEQEIESLYINNKIYKKITVSVIVPTKSYTIRGEVKIPGSKKMLGRVTLLRAVYDAGGFTEFANSKKITILRGGEVIRKNFREIEKDPWKDIEIQPDDNIRVHRGW